MAGGGSLMDIGIYSLQAARYVTGEEPIEIAAMSYTTPGDERFKEVEETINFQLRFPSGVLANCTLELRLLGAEPLPRRRHQGLVRARAGDELHGPAPAGPPRQRRSRSARCPSATTSRSRWTTCRECVMDGKEPLTPGEEGLRDLKLMMAIYEAARSGKTVKV